MQDNDYLLVWTDLMYWVYWVNRVRVIIIIIISVSMFLLYDDFKKSVALSYY